MTRRKVEPWLRASVSGARRHVTWIMRYDLLLEVDALCARLGVSRGVFFELAIADVLSRGGVGGVEGWHYDPVSRSCSVTELRREAMRSYVLERYGREHYR